MNKAIPYFFGLCLWAIHVNGAYNPLLSQKRITASFSPSKDSFILERTIPGHFLLMEVDVLNNLYLITAGNQLKKLNDRGDSIAVFNDVKKYGNPTFIDVNNPMKVMLYYKNYATVVVLDRWLNLRNSITTTITSTVAGSCTAACFRISSMIIQPFLLRVLFLL